MGYAGAEVRKNHLRFEMQPLQKGKKMAVYDVWNTDFADKIGEIHFRGGWRQYVFTSKNYDSSDIVEIDGEKFIPLRSIISIDMSRGCHKEIDTFIDELMEEWKRNLKKSKDVQESK